MYAQNEIKRQDGERKLKVMLEITNNPFRNINIFSEYIIWCNLSIVYTYGHPLSLKCVIGGIDSIDISSDKSKQK